MLYNRIAFYGSDLYFRSSSCYFIVQMEFRCRIVTINISSYSIATLNSSLYIKRKFSRMANALGKKWAITQLLGVCLPSVKKDATKIRITRFVLDERLSMYFKEHEFVYASDPNKCCKPGDTVLIKNLPKKQTRLITHEIIDVIYPLGNITDPITGKRVVSSRYRDYIQEDAEMFGILPSAYDFTKPTKRGRLEGTRDITDKPTYIKHLEDPNNKDPYAIDPAKNLTRS